MKRKKRWRGNGDQEDLQRQQMSLVTCARPYLRNHSFIPLNIILFIAGTHSQFTTILLQFLLD
uniref:Transmembrane protein n=1 Tax=Arundo donax TaxID=35708 RepID=A0A0A9GS55_ARUDO